MWQKGEIEQPVCLYVRGASSWCTGCPRSFPMLELALMSLCCGVDQLVSLGVSVRFQGKRRLAPIAAVSA
jgi:hypothetical protein